MTPTSLPLDAYYDSQHQCYLVEDDDKNWMQVNKDAIKTMLGMMNIPTRPSKWQHVSAADAAIVRIMRERNIAYSGPLAGYARGIHNIQGVKILVTQSPRIIQACKGDWSTLKTVFDNQYEARQPGEIDQRPYYHGWVMLADAQFRSCIQTGHVTYGQALILAGAKNSGKSISQLIISEILGGRNASPFGFMSGATPFNRELFCAEHQMIEDEQPHKDMKSRVRFGESIKQITASIHRACFGKNKEAQTLTPFWRLTISVNDEPDHLEVLPPFDNSLMDKIILLHCRKMPMPMAAGTGEEKRAFWEQLMSELPAYVYWLRNEFQIPEELKDPERYGVKAFFHPAIMTQLDDLAPETRLLSLIDHVLFLDGRIEWEGTAEEMARELFDSLSYGYQAKQLLSTFNWAGKMLGKLAKAKPERVSESRTSEGRAWIIKRAGEAPRRKTAAPPAANPSAARRPEDIDLTNLMTG